MTDNTDKETSNPHDTDSARIAKVIARAGLASRRDAELWVEQGRVAVNGKAITSPALNVGPSDRITVDGKPLPARERTRLWLYHKPRGLVTTAKDPEGRQTVFEVLPEDMPRVISVGRLDLNTEGLLLLTNDGGLARVLAHPDTAWLRRYRVRAYGDVTPDVLEGLYKGIEIDGFNYGPIEAEIDRRTGDNIWLVLGLREGKNREVRKVLEHLGLTVNRLIRISFGPFQLGDMAEGGVEEIRTRYLRDQLGGLAEDAGCDFDAPIVERKASEPKRPPRPGRDEPQEGGRRSAGLTTDRKGRRVLVERIEKEKPPARTFRDRDDRPQGARPPRDDRGPPRGDRDSRAPRRDGDAPRPFRAREDRPQGARPPRDDRGPPRGDRDSRPPRRDGDAPRPFRARDDRPQGARPPRDDRGPPRGDRDSRPPRREGEAPRPFGAREDRPQGARPPRDDRGPPRGDRDPRPPRRDGDAPRPFRAREDRSQGARPPREDRGPPRGDRDSRPPRRDGDKPDFGAKPRSFAARPSGPARSGAGKGPGPGPGRLGGSRPGGVRPSGGRPGGGSGKPRAPGGGGKPRTRG